MLARYGGGVKAPPCLRARVHAAIANEERRVAGQRAAMVAYRLGEHPVGDELEHDLVSDPPESELALLASTDLLRRRETERDL